MSPRRLTALALMITSALTACDERSSPRGELSGGRDGALPIDARPAAPPDVDPVDAAPDLAPADAAPPAPCPPFEAPAPAGSGLADLRVRATLSIGAPPGADAVWIGDLDGDPASSEVAVIRGARLEVSAADGAGGWRSPVLDLVRIITAADLDGDGRLELVAAARRSVFAFDGLTGVIRWSLPDAPFGAPPGEAAIAVQQVQVLDLDVDELADLYVTDSGCGDDGTGRAAVFGFAEGFPGRRIGRVEGPRLNGRCTRWHGFADLDLDGRPEVLVTDGDGLNGFDPLTGIRRWCGRFGAPSNGPLPHVAAGSGRFVFLPDAVGWVEATDDPTCEGALDLRWQVPLAGRRVEGSGPIPVGDGWALLTSRHDAETDSWQVWRAQDGRAEPLLEGRLLGIVGGSRALIARGEGATPARFGAVQLVDLAAEPPQPLWPLPIPRARPVYRAVDDQPGYDRTPELAGLLTLGHDLVLLRSAPGAESVTDRIERISPAGVLRAQRALQGEPGAIRQAGDGLVVAEPGGPLALLGPELALRFAADDGRPPVRAPAGTPRVVVAHDGLRPRPVAAVDGVAALLDPDREASPVRWQTAIGRPVQGGSPLSVVPARSGADGVLVRDALAGDAAWAVLDVGDGRRRWSHRLDPALWRPVGEAVVVDGPDGTAEVVARADLVLDPERWPADDPGCAVTVLPRPDPAAPADACPGFAVKPRVVRGLDPATGRCRWRLVLRPAYPCGGPSNQALSAADGDGDGWPELYLTETNAIRQIDARTGALRTTADLGFHDAGAVRGGGWLRGGPRGLARVGGNGPVEVFGPDLRLRWRAPSPDGIRLQAWIGRDGVVLDGEVWLSPAAAHPLMAWGLDDGALTAQVGVGDGAVRPDAPFGPGFPDVRGLAAVTDVDGLGGSGLLVTTDEGALYAVVDGQLAWSRHHAAALGGPRIAPLEVDGPRALLMPTADGRILVYGEAGPGAPPAVWDLPCPAPHSCDAEDDIDETEATDRLCAAWTPVAGVDGYEARVLGPNGALIAQWRAVPAPPLAWTGLELVPGVRYAVEVRSVVTGDGGARRSDAQASDGVLVVNDAPPTVALVAEPTASRGDRRPVRIGVVARDDDRLAGWQLEIRDRGDGLVRRLAGGPLATRRFEAEGSWNLEDTTKRPVVPDRYRAVVTVVDRGGLRARAEAPIRVCDGPCP